MQQVEVGPAVFADCYYFAIDHGIVREVLQCLRDVGKRLIEHVLPAGIERDIAARRTASVRYPSSLISSVAFGVMWRRYSSAVDIAHCLIGDAT
jgi:hypothetical protein